MATAKHRVTLYGQAAERGDRLTWGGGDHTVLRVSGLLRNAIGARYFAQAVTD